MAAAEGWLQVHEAVNFELIYQAVYLALLSYCLLILISTILLSLLRPLQMSKNLIFSSSKNVVPKIPVLLEQHSYLSAAFPSVCQRTLQLDFMQSIYMDS